MFPNLVPGALGLKADLRETFNLAQQQGWQGCDLPVAAAAEMAAAGEFDQLAAIVKESGMKLGGWGIPLNWRVPYDAAALAEFEAQTAVAARLGCTRTYTWVMPGSDERRFHENFAFHVAQLQPLAEILAAHGCRLGLEFVGPRTSRTDRRYGFLYSPDAMLCLAQAVGPNVGLLLDCWHWYTAMGTLADLRTLRAEDVVYVHVNDAPAGIAIEDQLDLVRRLPSATGVIPIADFLQALQALGYDGPVTPEPFDKQLAALPPDEASRIAREHMRRIWELAGLA